MENEEKTKKKKTMSIKRIREEIENSLKGLYDYTSDLIGKLEDIKISFEKMLSDVINPYSSSVESIYNVKNSVESFWNEINLDLREFLIVFPKILFVDLELMKKIKKGENDYSKMIADSVNVIMSINFFPQISRDILDVFESSVETIKKVKEFLEKIGQHRGILEDRYSEIINSIDSLVKRINETIRNVIKTKSCAESEAIIFLAKNLNESFPRKIIYKAIEEYIKKEFEKDIPIDDIKEEIKRTKELMKNINLSPGSLAR